MTVYLSSPCNQMQADHLAGMPVLLSFATWSDWMRHYVPSYRRVLLDSGAYTAFASGKDVDLDAYLDWAAQFEWADAFAGLDDISGNWRKSFANYERGGFPTFHDSDPPGLLDDLVGLARERGGWLGLGLVPSHATCSRKGREAWVRDSCARIPEDIHVHGWALRGYQHIGRLDSFDSTNWFRDALKMRTKMKWLTPAECVEIVVKRYQRETRRIKDEEEANLTLFGRD